jgi:transcriptional regulator with XRE-family HTH domain
MGEFGDKFRTAREKKELSLDDVSNVTKISARMLQAIEQEHFDLLPGGVFNKGFIRAYAKHLGMDPEDAVTDYLATLRQAQIDAHEVWEPQPPVPTRAAVAKTKVQSAEPKKPEPKSEPTVQVDELPELQLPRIQDVRPSRKEFLFRQDRGSPRILIASALVVVALSAFLWTRHSRPSRPVTAPPTPSQGAALASPPPSTAGPEVGAGLKDAGSSSQGSKPNSTPGSAPATQAASATPLPATPAAPDPKEDTASDVTVRTFGKPNANSTVKAAGTTLSLIIRAEETSWVSVQADGQMVTEETLIAPAHYTVHASREIIVRVGNAAGVNFIFNGKDLAAQGNESEAKTMVFDSSGMKVSP